MDKLPDELLNEIIEYVILFKETNQIERLRLVSKKFKMVVDDHYWYIISKDILYPIYHIVQDVMSELIQKI